MPLHFILTTGGTGGHIFPALATAQALVAKRPEARILFIGGLYGPERELAEKAGIDFMGLPVRGFLGRGLKALPALAAMGTGIVRAMKIVREFNPGAVMGFGGYAAFASVFAARMLGRPCAIHEQNAIPGEANKLLGKFVRKVCLSWPQPTDHPGFAPGKCVMTGNPIRSEISILGSSAGGRRPRRLLVMGGSLGARAINEITVSIFPELRKAGIDILHQTGAKEYDSVRAAYLASGVPQEEVDRCVRPFIHDMAEAYASCSLALCRAGATSMAELAATGTPAVYVPFPFAAHDHQTGNARAMQEAGGGVLLPQNDAARMRDEGRLAPMLAKLMLDEDRLTAMRAGALSLARPGAAAAVADILVDLAESGR